jgi:CTP synthase
LNKFNLEDNIKPELDSWISFLNKIKYPKSRVTVGLIGKYVELKDAYKSILEAFIHAGAYNECKVKVELIHSENISKGSLSEHLSHLDGILVAPGFGERGIEGKIETVKFARENNIPFFGICLGMQCATIEFARNVLNLKEAHTTEIEENTKEAVIYLMESQKSVTEKGGTMRLGSYACEVKKNTLAASIYKSEKISERHRHRFEFNNAYLKDFEKNGMIASGKNPETGLVEIVEIPEHPWFVGTQFHPEYKSTVDNPHPLFVSFIGAALKKHNS